MQVLKKRKWKNVTSHPMAAYTVTTRDISKYEKNKRIIFKITTKNAYEQLLQNKKSTLKLKIHIKLLIQVWGLMKKHHR